ncbi:MAG: hypothetical protein KN64_09500 [Sulfurovum sp. AS07-7]|nr:MAG: hypothetical protein KN64_09500 [Sulfurovum sp. AS07-7]
MKYLRGFGKRYFRFASIIAYSTASKLHANEIASKQIFSKCSIGVQDDEIDDDPPIELEFLLENTKVCRCAKSYKQSVRLTLLLNHFIPRCPYYTTWYAFRRTGTHPPFFI